MNIRAAVIQAASVIMNRDASVEKGVRLIEEAASDGARLILLPEAFVPAYPRGFTFGSPVGSRSNEGRGLWHRYSENSIEVPGPETEKFGRAAKKARAYVAVGVVEKESDTTTLYCSLIYFGPDGKLLGRHRKLKPTAAERVIWGEGDGSTLTVLDTEIGRWGGLICWENYMPMARMAMYGKKIGLYMAPTADQRDAWQSTLRHIAVEGRCFVLGCNQFVTRSMYPNDIECMEEIEKQDEIMCRGGSAIVSPMGEYLAGPLWDEEGILYADLDLSLIEKGRFDFDVTGHYARPDVFKLIVNENPLKAVETE